jgi:hypothetical protein
VSFVTSALLFVSQVMLWMADVAIFLLGNRPFLFILAGTGAMTAANVAMTLWLYCSFTAYAAFWFVTGMGLRMLSEPRASA